jgi:cell division septation protein DedD
MPAAPATALDNTDEHSTTALYRAAIGEVNSAYYLPLFTKFEAADRAGLSWNWSAALYTLNWMAFRQLWHAALLYLGCMLTLLLGVFGIGRLVFQLSEEMQWGLLAGLVLLSILVPGLGGNALLHAATRKRMQAALVASTDVQEACALLARQASSRKRLLLQAALNAVLLALAAYSWTSFTGFTPLPGYADKTPDARNLAVGRTTDATAAAAASSAPASAASAPMNAAIAKPAVAASAPVLPASASAQLASPPPASAASASASMAAASAPALAAAKPKPVEAAKPVPVAPAPKVAPPARPASAPAASPAKASAPAKPRAARVKPEPAAAAPANTEPVPVAATRFVVNVGLFAQENNARNAFTKLMDANLPASSQELNTPKGKRYRVRVGPFETQVEADTAAEKIRAMELDALVAPQ